MENVNIALSFYGLNWILVFFHTCRTEIMFWAFFCKFVVSLFLYLIFANKMIILFRPMQILCKRKDVKNITYIELLGPFVDYLFRLYNIPFNFLVCFTLWKNIFLEKSLQNWFCSVAIFRKKYFFLENFEKNHQTRKAQNF